MKTILAIIGYILALQMAVIISSCNQNKKMKKTIVQHFHLTDTEDDVNPPPQQFEHSQKSIQEWLKAICDANRPQTRVSYYETGVFDSENMRILYLMGVDKNGDHKKIVFQPQNMYFLLPDEYKDLTQEQIDKKLIDQLVDFTKSEFFYNSYLAEADSILFRGTMVIWSKSK
jgi:hypothetical protein